MDKAVGKFLWESKTVIFNVVMMLVLIADALPALDIPGAPEWLGVAAGAVAVVGNIILRVWFTDQPIVTKK